MELIVMEWERRKTKQVKEIDSEVEVSFKYYSQRNSLG